MWAEDERHSFAEDWQEFKRGNVFAAFPAMFFLLLVTVPPTILIDQGLYWQIEHPEWRRFVNGRRDEMDRQARVAWYREHGANGVSIPGVVYELQRADADGDGFTIIAGDCNDFWKEVSPKASELCNGVDDDCDFQADEGLDECGFWWRWNQRFQAVKQLVSD